MSSKTKKVEAQRLGIMSIVPSIKTLRSPSTGTIIYTFSAAAAFVCFVPFFYGAEENAGRHCHSTSPIMANGLKSHFYREALIASIAINLPIVMDVTLDAFANGWQSAIRLFRRWILTVLSLSIELTLYFYISPTANAQLFWPLLHLREIFVVSACIDQIRRTGSSFFGNEIAIAASISFSTADVLKQASQAMFSYHSSLSFVSSVFFFVPCVAVMFAFCRMLWSICFGSVADKEKKKSYRGVLPACQLCGIIVGMCVIVAAFGPLDLCDLDGAYLAAYTYMLSGFLILSSLLYSRKSKFQAVNSRQSLEMKRLFVRYVSHEIRTPLNIVSTGLKLLKSLKEKPQLFQNMQSIPLLVDNIFDMATEMKESCDVAVNILNDLLLYEKLEGGILVVEKKPEDARELIDTAVKAFAIQAREAEINLIFNFEDGFYPTAVDEEMGGGVGVGLRLAMGGELSPPPPGSGAGVLSCSGGMSPGSGGLSPPPRRSSLLGNTIAAAAAHAMGAGGGGGRPPPGEIYIDVDKPKICQVLRNLVSNAIKFSPPGSNVTVRTSLRARGQKHRQEGGVPIRRYNVSSAEQQYLSADDLSVKPQQQPISLPSTLASSSSLSSSLLSRVFNALPSVMTGARRRRISAARNTGKVHATGGGTHRLVSYGNFSIFNRERSTGSVHENEASSPIDRLRRQSITALEAQKSFLGLPKLSSASSDVDYHSRVWYVRVDVKDSGVGLTPENQAKLFKEIIQFNPNELQGGNGSGLGLFISKGIMDLHDGRIGVFSAGEGYGSTFYIEIPVCSTPVLAAAAAAAVSSTRGLPASVLASARHTNNSAAPSSTRSSFCATPVAAGGDIGAANGQSTCTGGTPHPPPPFLKDTGKKLSTISKMPQHSTTATYLARRGQIIKGVELRINRMLDSIKATTAIGSAHSSTDAHDGTRDVGQSGVGRGSVSVSVDSKHRTSSIGYFFGGGGRMDPREPSQSNKSDKAGAMISGGGGGRGSNMPSFTIPVHVPVHVYGAPRSEKSHRGQVRTDSPLMIQQQQQLGAVGNSILGTETSSGISSNGVETAALKGGHPMSATPLDNPPSIGRTTAVGVLQRGSEGGGMSLSPLVRPDDLMRSSASASKSVSAAPTQATPPSVSAIGSFITRQRGERGGGGGGIGEIVASTSTSISWAPLPTDNQEQQLQPKILVVDDSGANRKMLIRLLKMNGICDAPTQAADGLIAFNTVKELLEIDRAAIAKELEEVAVYREEDHHQGQQRQDAEVAAGRTTEADDVSKNLNCVQPFTEYIECTQSGQDVSQSVQDVSQGVQIMSTSRTFSSLSCKSPSQILGSGPGLGHGSGPGPSVALEASSPLPRVALEASSPALNYADVVKAAADAVTFQFYGDPHQDSMHPQQQHHCYCCCSPDVILMDFVMPNMSGPAATELLRSEGYRGLIVGVTGNALTEDIEFFVTSGADAVLTKPIDVNELVTIIEQREMYRDRWLVK